jgi:hypothetical protein
MKIKVWFAIALLVVCTGVFAQDQKQKPPSAEEQAMMAAWMKYMTPGDGHKLLDGMAGTWDTKVTSWMMPGQPPMESTGVSEVSWILGGRYLQEKATGSFMGQPFNGIGITAYDNAKKQYVGTWIDNMGTGVATETGSASSDGKVWTFKSVSTDPMTGKDTPGEMKITVADKDHHTSEMWGPGPDGKMFKMMEIAYTRKK